MIMYLHLQHAGDCQICTRRDGVFQGGGTQNDWRILSRKTNTGFIDIMRGWSLLTKPLPQGGLYLDTDMELGPRTFDHEQLYDARCWMVQDSEAIVQNHLFRAPPGHAFLSFLLKVYLVNVFEEAHVVQVRVRSCTGPLLNAPDYHADRRFGFLSHGQLRVFLTICVCFVYRRLDRARSRLRCGCTIATGLGHRPMFQPPPWISMARNKSQIFSLRWRSNAWRSTLEAGCVDSGMGKM